MQDLCSHLMNYIKVQLVLYIRHRKFQRQQLWLYIEADDGRGQQHEESALVYNTAASGSATWSVHSGSLFSSRLSLPPPPIEYAPPLSGHGLWCILQLVRLLQYSIIRCILQPLFLLQDAEMHAPTSLPDVVCSQIHTSAAVVYLPIKLTLGRM